MPSFRTNNDSNGSGAAGQGEGLPDVLGHTDFGEVESIYAPHVREVCLRTLDVAHDSGIPGPGRDDVLGTVGDDGAALGSLAHAIFDRLDVDQEHFVLLTCNAQNRPYGFKVVASGSRTDVSVDPGLVFRAALLLGAVGVVVTHNHTSGDPSPSRDDLHLTVRLITAGDVINVPVLDHVILGRAGRCLSLRAEHGYLWA